MTIYQLPTSWVLDSGHSYQRKFNLTQQNVTMACDRGIDKRCDRTWGRISGKQTGQVRMTLTDEQLKGLVRRFDTDRDHRLSKQELKDAFHSLGSRFPAWRVWRALSHADANGDGYISEHELDGLIKYIVKHDYAKK